MPRFKKGFVLLMLVTIVGMGSAVVGIGSAQTPGQSVPPKHFKLEGTVKSVDAQNHKLVVDHKEIPGFMKAMTMPYRDNAQGQKDNRTFYLYQYTFALVANKTVVSVTLPNNRNVVVLAASLTNASASNRGKYPDK